MRIGHGYDVHTTTEGDHVMLGGERIAAPFGVRAHSDGDVALHALCDALLGAAALGDIGRHFPDDEPAWAGAAGQTLLRRTAALVRDRGWVAVNADITIVAERPRVGPHVDAMRENIAAELDLGVGSQIREARLRVEHGVKEELVDLAGVRGVGRKRARRLYDAGIEDRTQLREADKSVVLAALRGREKTAENILENAGHRNPSMDAVDADEETAAQAREADATDDTADDQANLGDF